MKALRNMYIIMKTLRLLGIPNWHNIHNLKYSQNSTSAVPQVNVHVHNVPNVPKQHIIYVTYSGWFTQPVWSRLCQIRLHHVLPAPQRCWGLLGRSEQAVFRGPKFWRIGENGRPAPISASARIAKTGANVARWFHLLHCARDTRVCWNRNNIFWFMVCRKWRPKPIFPLLIYWDPFEE